MSFQFLSQIEDDAEYKQNRECSVTWSIFLHLAILNQYKVQVFPHATSWSSLIPAWLQDQTAYLYKVRGLSAWNYHYF